MKSRRSLNPRAGGALLFALLLCAVAGFLTASWISLVTARSLYTNTLEDAIKRRIAVENARSLAQQYLLEQVVFSTAGNEFAYSLSDNWGGITVPAWSGTALGSIAKAAGVNHFNPGSGDGYTFDLPITLSGSDTDLIRKFQVKSRSPALAGWLFSGQVPTLVPTATSSVTGALSAAGMVVLWAPNSPNLFSLTALRYATPTVPLPTNTLVSPANATLLINDLAFPPQTAGPAGALSGYAGQLNVINNPSFPANSLAAKLVAHGYLEVNPDAVLNSNGITSDGDGHVTIDLDEPHLGNVLLAEGAHTLTLVGQTDAAAQYAAGNLPAILIVVDQSASSPRDLTLIDCQNRNSRKVLLAVKKAGSGSATTISFAAAGTNPLWRLLLTIENSPVSLSIGGAGIVTVQGGIRTDRGLEVTGGSVELAPETDPKLLERLADRTAWVESYLQ